MLLESSDEEFVAKVREVVTSEDFFGRAAENDRLATYPAANMAALKLLGVQSMNIQKEFGGPAYNTTTMARVVETIAYADPTTAACMNMHWVNCDLLNDHSYSPTARSMLERVATENIMFAGGSSIPAGDLNPDKAGARGKRVDGGWRVTGRVGYATNSGGAAYVGCIAAVLDDDGKLLAPLKINIEPDAPGVTVLQDWNALGLRASTTNTIVFDDAFVPDTLGFELVRAKSSEYGIMGEYSRGHASSQITKGAMWMGLCMRIRDYLIEYITKRSGTIATKELNPDAPHRYELAWAQSSLGHIEHWIESGRRVIYTCTDDIEDDSLNAVQRMEMLQFALYHMKRMCEEVSMHGFRMAGAHGIVANRPFERMYRDLMAYIATAFKSVEMVEHMGKAVLGMPFKVNASGG
jgi:alkylation response protein AidB-like acyl-CoA dehydrogenase